MSPHLPADAAYRYPRGVHPEVVERVERLELPFNRYGIDPYGVSKPHLAVFFTMLRAMHRSYFTTSCMGLEHVPARGRAMLVGNHSGGYAIDAGLMIASMLLDMQTPRLAQGMAEKFINKLPVASLWTSRVGQFTGLPEHASRLLEDDRLLMVFPEGARGTAKLFTERHSLVNFGTGFVRLALQTKTPIVPTAVLGGGEALPTVMNAYSLGRLVGAPYVPITPYLLPVPLPAHFDIYYGEPVVLEGEGDEEDEVIQRHVDRVKARIAAMIEAGVDARKRRGPFDTRTLRDTGA